MSAPTYQQFMAEVGPYVNRVVSPCGRLCLFNYTRECQYESAWNAVNVYARGIVFEIATGKLVAQPFKKFFNYGEPQAASITAKGLPLYVMEKLDGCLGISFVYDNRVWFITRGSFTSRQAAKAAAMWLKLEENYLHPEQTTLLWEIICEESKIVVEYKRYRLVLIGGFCRGRELSPAVTGTLASRFVCDTPWQEIPMDIPSLKKKADQYDHNNEGYVLMWRAEDGTYNRVKVKGEEYCRVHRLLAGINDRRIADLWYAGESLSNSYPEETRQYVQSYCRKLDGAVENSKTYAQELLEEHGHHKSNLDFAKAIGFKNPMLRILTALRKGIEPNYKLYVYKANFPTQPRPVKLKTA